MFLFFLVTAVTAPLIDVLPSICPLPRVIMSGEEVAGIGALLKPNKYSILKFVDLHPGGAAALSGQVAIALCPCAWALVCGQWRLAFSAREAAPVSAAARGCRAAAWPRNLCVYFRADRLPCAAQRSPVARCTRMIDWWRWTAWWCVA